MPVHLTKIDLDDRIRNVRRSTAGDHHRILMKLVSNSLGRQRVDSPRQKAGLLFRVEDARDGRYLLVQSQSPLCLENLPSGFGVGGTKDITPLLEHISAGDVVRYRVTASPMKRLGKSSMPRQMWTRDNKRLSSGAHELPLSGEAADNWWEGKAGQGGLDLLSAYSTRLPEHVDGRSDRKVRMPAVRFDGLARVRDADAVRTAVLNGIGRGKAFGCGLLSLAYPET